MLNCFNIQERHIIDSANKCYFENCHPHPDRILDEHDFIYLAEGGWGIGQNGISYKLLPDDVLILKAGEHHYNVSDTLPKTKTLYIHANAAEGDCFADGMSEKSESRVYLGTKISCRGYDRPKELFSEIIFEFWSDDSRKDIKVSALFDILLCELSKIEHIQTSSIKNNCIYESLYTINTNPQKFYKVKELAEMFFVSEKYLENMFIRYTGKPVHEYQTAKKIDMIKARIHKDPYITLKETAKEYGFYDEFHLSKVFKKHTGVSPKEYKTAK